MIIKLEKDVVVLAVISWVGKFCRNTVVISLNYIDLEAVRMSARHCFTAFNLTHQATVSWPNKLIGEAFQDVN